MPTTSALLRVFAVFIFSLATTLTFAAPTSPIAILEPTNARYPGTLKLDVDVTDTERKIHKARLQIPVAPGPLTLLFPQWLPGNHAPNGIISGLSGLTIKANGKSLDWTRDTIQVFAFHLTVPAGVLGPTAIQLPVAVPAQTVTTQGQLFPVPAQDIKLMDPNSFAATLDVKWLLFDGGMRSGLRQQTEAQVAAMKEAARRTDLEIADSVRRMYHGSVLARQLHQLGDDTLARMEATLNLTETMYKEGGGKVFNSKANSC